jgi:hypothetical protein
MSEIISSFRFASAGGGGSILVDASSPVRFTGSTASNTNIDSASFTAPANSLIVLCIEHDGDSGSTGTLTITPSLTTGSAITWIQQVARTLGETTDGGSSFIYTAIATTSEARVVRINSVWTVNTGASRRRSAKIYVVTGATIGGTYIDTVGANNEGGSGTNNLTTSSITPGGTGLLFAADCDWNQLGTMTSSDLTLDTADYAGAISVADGYKTTTSGVGTTANLNAGGTGGAQHKWCQITIL